MVQPMLLSGLSAGDKAQRRTAVRLRHVTCQMNGKCRTFAGRAVDRHRAAVQFDQGLRKGQPKTRAGVFPVKRAVDLTEGGEREIDILRGHTDAGIGDNDVYPVAGLADRESYNPPGGREFDCVAQQVQNDLGDLPVIALDDLGRGIAVIRHQRQVFGFRALSHHACAFIQDDGR